MKKLWDSSTFQLIVLILIITALIAYNSDEVTWKDFLDQLRYYLGGYVIKESVVYGSSAYKERGNV